MGIVLYLEGEIVSFIIQGHNQFNKQGSSPCLYVCVCVCVCCVCCVLYVVLCVLYVVCVCVCVCVCVSKNDQSLDSHKHLVSYKLV